MIKAALDFELTKIVDISKDFGARKVLLFGSCLEDPVRARDIDIAVSEMTVVYVNVAMVRVNTACVLAAVDQQEVGMVGDTGVKVDSTLILLSLNIALHIARLRICSQSFDLDVGATGALHGADAEVFVTFT